MEKKERVNIGIDFRFLDDRISGNIDYYNRKTEDLLWDYTVPSPPYLYSSMVANAGSMKFRYRGWYNRNTHTNQRFSMDNLDQLLNK